MWDLRTASAAFCRHVSNCSISILLNIEGEITAGLTFSALDEQCLEKMLKNPKFFTIVLYHNVSH